MTQFKEVLRQIDRGLSQRSIATNLGCSRNTVSKVAQQAEMHELTWSSASQMSEEDILQTLFPDAVVFVQRSLPDLDYVHREMKKPHVTLSLLWAEYCEECRQEGKTPLMYSQFCHHYRQYRHKTQATMRLPRNPGEQTEVDWAGQVAYLKDPDTGEKTKVHIFVGALSYSQYAYVEGFLRCGLSEWIQAHIHMFNYFGDVTKIIVPDNLKTGVSKPDPYFPEIQENYQEMARHYDTVIVPARIKKPKDKPNVEGTVGVISTWILAALRNQTFFTLESLNEAIQERLEAYNSRDFQKKEGSRQDLYLEEKPLLLPLPRESFELANWKVATVQFNYHISVDGMNYSIPFEYIKQKVRVKVTSTTIQVFSGTTRICSHRRLYGRKGQYRTVELHMPPEHQQYLTWDSQRFQNWANQIGPGTRMTVDGILGSLRIKQQAFKSCMGLLKLANRYTPDLLEQACLAALEFTPTPSYKTIKKLLDSGWHTKTKSEQQDAEIRDDLFAFTRGAAFYEGESTK